MACSPYAPRSPYRPAGDTGFGSGYALAFDGAHTPPRLGCEPFPDSGLRMRSLRRRDIPGIVKNKQTPKRVNF